MRFQNYSNSGDVKSHMSICVLILQGTKRPEDNPENPFICTHSPVSFAAHDCSSDSSEIKVRSSFSAPWCWGFTPPTFNQCFAAGKRDPYLQWLGDITPQGGAPVVNLLKNLAHIWGQEHGSILYLPRHISRHRQASLLGWPCLRNVLSDFSRH